MTNTESVISYHIKNKKKKKKKKNIMIKKKKMKILRFFFLRVMIPWIKKIILIKNVIEN